MTDLLARLRELVADQERPTEPPRPAQWVECVDCDRRQPGDRHGACLACSSRATVPWRAA